MPMDSLRIVGAACLLLLGSDSWAAQEKIQHPRTQIDVLEHSAGDPDNFKNVVDGSLERPGNPAVAAVPDLPGTARPAPALSPGRPSLRSGPAEFPPIPTYAERTAPSSRNSASNLFLPGLAVGWGLLCTLLLLGDSAGPARAPAPLAYTPEPVAPAPILLTETPASPASAAVMPAPGPFIDTRMPCPTWRAISQQEQQLIDQWDRSREKTLGLASLDEWLDSRAGAPGVDIQRLKAKLHRDV